ncbi:MAG: 16S rRNA (adenine(1518)-N(6)/adenine(1519)-N(6))-dimethyltransferase RsmA [Burkholderiales bacterium]|nr:16S rRNA (adenine(1518)-N(6)/adenine(1519)-N(6))-dimethyltransferase RsmA [Burkholderiales bacterium]
MHHAKKRFGQNFLRDAHFVRACIEAIRPQASDTLVEIGPGLGALTRPLLAQLPHLHVVEIDRDLIAKLHAEFPPAQMTIHEGDALKFDFSKIGDKLRIVGNLPYNISTPLLFHLADFAERIIDMHFMLQKEVVERMVAAPSSSDYGRLSVMLQYRFDMVHLFDVPGAAFQPAPKVTSSFVGMRPLHPLPYPARDLAMFAKIVSAAFSTRRKTLRNALKTHLTDHDFATLGIDPILRAENLAVADFVRIANYRSALPAGG